MPELYSWEEEYRYSWNQIQEDEKGCLDEYIRNFELLTESNRLENERARMKFKSKTSRKNLMRHLVIVVDASECENDTDIWPTRFHVIRRQVVRFVRQFFDENPLSHIGIIIGRNEEAERIVKFGATPKQCCDAFTNFCNREKNSDGYICQGTFSLHACLDLVVGTLKTVPMEAARSAIILTSSLNTNDSQNVYERITKLNTMNTQCSVISLVGEVFVFQQMAKLTKGKYFVAVDETDMMNILDEYFVTSVGDSPKKPSNLPVKTINKTMTYMMKVAFPSARMKRMKKKNSKKKVATLCYCHLMSASAVTSQYLTDSKIESVDDLANITNVLMMGDDDVEKRSNTKIIQYNSLQAYRLKKKKKLEENKKKKKVEKVKEKEEIDGKKRAKLPQPTNHLDLRPRYFCSRCSAKYCSVPIECRVCASTLLFAPYLMKHASKLFNCSILGERLGERIEYGQQMEICLGCNDRTDYIERRCKKCDGAFCIECAHIYCVNSIFKCPNC
ncbi:hypothetical protein SNEBB_008543 [Seison nebaliae]|nr:hypothetical protein SNEBB_008543 [Seison nebaliae]